MTYSLILIPFAVVTAIITAVSARRPGFGRRMTASALTAAVLLVLTAVFDSLMIAAGLVVYPPGNFSGLRIGLAPIEDFAYPLCGAFLIPAVFALLDRRPER